MTRHVIATALFLGTATLLACDDVTSKSMTSQVELIASVEKDDVRMNIHAESLSAETGEPIEIIVTIEAPPSLRARLILPEEHMLGEFEVLRMEEVRRFDDALSVSDKRRLLISTFESGEVELPPLLAHYGTDSVLATEPVQFSISSLVEGEFNPADYEDIRGTVDDSLGDDRVAWAVFALAAGGVLVLAPLAIMFALGKRRRVHPRIPHEWALAELARINAEGPPRANKTTNRLEKIETILRWYVAFRFDIDAPDQTSNELVDSVVAHGEIDDSARAVLERIVRDADRVKFAASIVTVEECHVALGSARLFVEATIPATQGKEHAA